MTIKEFFAPSDMTTGRPWEKILLFVVPMLVGNIAQQLYNTVDSIVVGKYVGDNALAAVGSAGPIFNLLLVLFVGISTGVGIMVSQYFGAKQREQLSLTIGNSITLTAVASLFLMLLSFVIIRPLLHLLNTPESIFEWCHGYLFILMMGIAGLGFYNMLSGILRGLGDSISALVYLLIATFLNIILDLFFVKELGLGVSGVALATVIAQSVSSIMCLKKLSTMTDVFDLKWQYIVPNKNNITTVIKLGLPSGLTQAIFSMAMIMVQSLTNSFGEMLIAANVIIMRVDGFAMMPNFTFGMAMTTYAGQNVGAGRYDRVEEGCKQGTLIAVAFSTIVTSLILLFGHHLMFAFTDTEELVSLAMHLMRIIAVGYIAMAAMQTLSGVMRGAGDTMSPMWISLITTVMIRVPLAYGISYATRTPELPYGKQECIFVSMLISWMIGTVLTFIMYRRGNWKKKAIQ